MIVLDTTVLVYVYAKGADHPLREPCRALIEAAAAGRVDATTSVEVIQEFAHVRARRRGRDDAAQLAGDDAELLSPLLQVTAEHLQQGLAMFGQAERLGAFDSVLAAATIGVGATALVSADEGFGEVPQLSHVRPDAAGVAGLLGGR